MEGDNPTSSFPASSGDRLPYKSQCILSLISVGFRHSNPLSFGKRGRSSLNIGTSNIFHQTPRDRLVMTSALDTLSSASGSCHVSDVSSSSTPRKMYGACRSLPSSAGKQCGRTIPKVGEYLYLLQQGPFNNNLFTSFSP